MNDARLTEIAKQWFEAFNAHDLEQLLSLYADEAQHFSPKLRDRKPETKGFISGKKELGRWWADAFGRLPSLHYEIKRFTPSENRVFMEYVRHVNEEEDLYVGEMLEIENGKIISSVVFHR
jgi:hypothetical protein